jgi:hypothetical protein
MNCSALAAMKALGGFVRTNHFSRPYIICFIQGKAIHNEKRGRLTQHYVASQHVLFLYLWTNLACGILLPAVEAGFNHEL